MASLYPALSRGYGFIDRVCIVFINQPGFAIRDIDPPTPDGIEYETDLLIPGFATRGYKHATPDGVAYLDVNRRITNSMTYTAEHKLYKETGVWPTQNLIING